MVNPIIARMTNNQNNIASLIQMVKGNPQAYFDNMMKTNPQFAKFVEDCKGKKPEQIMKEYGLDPALINRFMK